jgi:hypothetical protein
VKSGLMVASSGNVDTFTNVLWAINKHLSDFLRIEKLLLLDTGDATLDFAGLQQRAHMVLGRAVEMRVKPLGDDSQWLIPRVVVDGANEVGRDGLVVDLTTGTKTVSAILYACASFSQLRHLYYVSVERGEKGFYNLWLEPDAEKKHKLSALSPLEDVHELASHSFFDLIFYREELDKIDKRVKLGSDLAASVQEVTNYLRTALPHFFSKNPDYLSAMRSIGAARERLQPIVLQAACLINNTEEPKTLRQLDEWSEQYRDSRLGVGSSETGRAIAGTFVLDAGLRLLQSWRNRASHPPPPEFTQSDIRTAIAVTVTLLEAVVAVHTNIEGT